MEIRGIVVGGVQVDVVNDFTLPRLCNFAVFPFAPVSLRAIPKAVVLNHRGVGPVALLNGWICDWRGFRDRVHHRAYHQVAVPLVRAARQAVLLLFIRVKRVTVPMPHLIVPDAHLACRDRTVTVFTGAANDAASPPIFRRSMPHLALVVHQAKSVCSVSSAASVDGARAIGSLGCHKGSISRYKALGSSMAVPCMAWIGERIAFVENLTEKAAT
jgi:hypothetical protein